MKRIAICVTVSYLRFCIQASGQSGIITNFAGGGTGGIGDGGPATAASLFFPWSGVTDASGNVFIADAGNNRIRKVSPDGIITTVAGSGDLDFSGDGGPATSAAFNNPTSVAVDASGNLFIADPGNHRVRKVSAASGIITTYAGNGTKGFSGDGGLATSASLAGPGGLSIDTSGNLFIGDGSRIRKVSPSGAITTVAGNGTSGFSGDGGPATSAAFYDADSVAVDASGNLFIADFTNNRIRKVSSSGIITTYAGNGVPGFLNGGLGSFSGDGGPATAAGLNGPNGIALDASGNLFIAERYNERIRKVSADGTITTVAGNGTFGSSGDGGPATSASFNAPVGVFVDTFGNLFIADYGASRVRKVSGVASQTLPPPSIATGGIVPVNSTATTIQPGEWVSIYGANLASSTATWNGDFPTSLGGTSVTINGKAAYLWFVSLTQINLQAPDDTATGPVLVAVKTAAGTSSSTVTLAQFAPSFSLADNRHVTGIIPRADGSGAYGGGTYDILGPTGNSLGYASVAAKAGDKVELFGYGFGPTSPVVPAGQPFSGAAPTTNPVTILINNVSVTAAFVGLSSAGLYQINLTVPAGLDTGDIPLVATVSGAQTPPTVVISLQ